MLHHLDINLESQLKHLLEIFNGEDIESLELGVALFKELFPDNSIFILGYVNEERDRPYYMSMYEIVNFIGIPRYTLSTIIYHLLNDKIYFTYDP